jgi:hypothetical protein
MISLTTLLAEGTTWAGSVLGSLAALLLTQPGRFVIKKAVDLVIAVFAARLSKEKVKESICIYAPDGTVARRVKIESG